MKTLRGVTKWLGGIIEKEGEGKKYLNVYYATKFWFYVHLDSFRFCYFL